MAGTETFDARRKAVDAAADWLAFRARADASGAMSRAHILAVVPTAQSGRRLRYALAKRFPSGIVPPLVRTPAHLVEPDAPPPADSPRTTPKFRRRSTSFAARPARGLRRRGSWDASRVRGVRPRCASARQPGIRSWTRSTMCSLRARRTFSGREPCRSRRYPTSAASRTRTRSGSSSRRRPAGRCPNGAAEICHNRNCDSRQSGRCHDRPPFSRLWNPGDCIIPKTAMGAAGEPRGKFFKVQTGRCDDFAFGILNSAQTGCGA